MEKGLYPRRGTWEARPRTTARRAEKSAGNFGYGGWLHVPGAVLDSEDEKMGEEELLLFRCG